MVQHMWESSTLPTELTCTDLVLTPKGNTDTWGIWMLEVLWKIVEAIIDTWIKMVVMFYNVLHGLLASRGTRMAMMDLKMAQELAIIDQDPLFLVFLNLRKSCDTLDRGRILHTLEGCGVGPNIRGLLAEFGRTRRWTPGRTVIIACSSGRSVAQPRRGLCHQHY